MWTLILVLVIATPATPGSPAAAAVEHVPGFEDQTACQAAADAWREMAAAGSYRSLCVSLQAGTERDPCDEICRKGK